METPLTTGLDLGPRALDGEGSREESYLGRKLWPGLLNMFLQLVTSFELIEPPYGSTDIKILATKIIALEIEIQIRHCKLLKSLPDHHSQYELTRTVPSSP